jgi:hypothetical protein
MTTDNNSAFVCLFVIRLTFLNYTRVLSSVLQFLHNLTSSAYSHKRPVRCIIRAAEQSSLDSATCIYTGVIKNCLYS